MPFTFHLGNHFIHFGNRHLIIQFGQYLSVLFFPIRQVRIGRPCHLHHPFCLITSFNSVKRLPNKTSLFPLPGLLNNSLYLLPKYSCIQLSGTNTQSRSKSSRVIYLLQEPFAMPLSCIWPKSDARNKVK